MSETERYEVLVIGSGESGKWITWTMAQAGHRTAVVERKYIGGSCPNIACLPSKNVIRSAKANWFAKHGAEYGIQSGPAQLQLPEECQYSDHWRTGAENRSRNAEDEKLWPQVAERNQGDPFLDGFELGYEDRRARQRRSRPDFEPDSARVSLRR